MSTLFTNAHNGWTGMTTEGGDSVRPKSNCRIYSSALTIPGTWDGSGALKVTSPCGYPDWSRWIFPWPILGKKTAFVASGTSIVLIAASHLSSMFLSFSCTVTFVAVFLIKKARIRDLLLCRDLEITYQNKEVYNLHNCCLCIADRGEQQTPLSGNSPAW